MKPKFFIKIIVSLFMLWLVLRYVDLKNLSGQLLSISIPSLILIIVWYTLGQCVSAFKWTLIARSGGVPISYPRALKAYFIGMFVNCYGLGVVGGDLARGLLLGEGHSMKAEAFTSVIADRLHGLCMLALIGSAGAAFLLLVGAYSQPAVLVYSLAILGAGMLCAWFAGPAVLLRFIPAESRWRVKIESVLSVFPKGRRFALISLISICFHLTQIFLHWFIAYQLGTSIPLEYLFVAIPLVNILSTLPISWNGLGVRERSYKGFLVPAVLTDTQAVGLGFVWLFAVLMASAVGGIIAFITGDFETVLRKRVSDEAMPASTDEGSLTSKAEA